MNYYLGIDGGGTKTAFVLSNEDGTIIGEHISEGISYRQIGIEGVAEVCSAAVTSLCRENQVNPADLSICIGLPNYGESRVSDQRIEALLKESLLPAKTVIVNDCEVGLAGSFGIEPGINIVAGTGSIAFGRNSAREVARSGGWSETFGDEGSCRWLGMKAMECFSKESDGRLPKGALYALIKEQFQVEEDFDVIDIFEAEYYPYRSKIASLQKVLFAAAKAGDASAISLYDQAAGELASIILAVYQKLWKTDEVCRVSYSGGLFKTGDMILSPLREKLSQYPMELVTPKYQEPVYGAVELAAELNSNSAAR